MNQRSRTAAAKSENFAAALCYILGPVSGLAFLLLPPYNLNRRVRFHGMQSILFSLAMVASTIGVSLVSPILPSTLIPILTLLFMLMSLGAMGVWIYVIRKNGEGENVRLPGIGPLADRIANR